MTYRLSEKEPFLKLKAILHQQGKKRRFPSDTEFREALETRDVYGMRTCHYLFDRIENDSKEQTDASGLTIEHILPQNEDLPNEWQKMLGSKWQSIQETWQHRLGNLTLTGYNSEYSDLPFDKKKALVDREGRKVGLDFSPLRLNQVFRKQKRWTQKEIEDRGKTLASQAISIWPSLKVDLSVVRAFELEELKASAKKYKVADLKLGKDTRTLFDKLRKQILAIGEDIIELPGENTVAYRVYEFFVEIIPRKRRLTLVLNLDFEEIDDPTQRATDSTERAFIINATESGGVLFRVEEPDDIGAAVHLIRQAYEKVSE